MKTWLIAAMAAMLVGGGAAEGASTVFYQVGVTGATIQSTPAVLTNFNGTFTALVPRFNGGLGTLIQADFEFAVSSNSSWTSLGPPTGNIALSMSGVADVDGVNMGPISAAYSGGIVTVNPSVYSDGNFANLTETSGAHFATLTGVGNVTMTYVYSGTNSVDIAPNAVGTFDWGGSVHVLYTYIPAEETPEAGTLGVMGCGAAALLRRRRGGG